MQLPNNNQVHCLGQEIEWFHQVLARRINSYFEQETTPELLEPPQVPNLDHDQSAYAQQVRHFCLSEDERLIVILALIPHLFPAALDTFLVRNQNLDRPYCEFGGWLGNRHGGFLPTLETAVFLLAGADLERRLEVTALFESHNILRRERLLHLDSTDGEPFLSCPLQLSDEAFDLFTIGEHRKPAYSIRFPAHLVTTPLNWDDLVLQEKTMEGLEELFTWIKHGKTLLQDWGLGRFMQPGFHALFHGPPGTGKTLSASLIGKCAGMEVYRIDLAAVVSKYIGETEKNLAVIFRRAAAKNWILFFDEADALFARRTTVATANDRHGNQEVAYLLQAIENFPGVVILATNLRANLDDAFFRRFQSQVYFPMPGPEQRLRLWKNCLKDVPHRDLDLVKLADHEISGSEITNVLRKAALQVLASGDDVVEEHHLNEAMGTVGKRAKVALNGALESGTAEEPRRWKGLG